MAGADKIKEKILDEARQQAQFSMNNAQKEADEILKNAQKEANEKEEKAISNAKETSVERKKRIISVAQLEARKERLSAKQEVIEEAFNNTFKKLKAMPNKQYEEIITKMVVETATTGNEEILLSKYDKDRLSADFIKNINEKLENKKIKGNVKISNEVRNIEGGFILRKGDVEINNSFEVIIRMRRDELEAEVIKILFK